MISNLFDEIEVGDLIEGVDGPVTRKAINRYAETSGDRNPIHTTYEVAMAAGLGGVIQHGLFSMGWLIKTVSNWIGGNGKLKHINIQFRAMVRPNDLVYSRGKIVKKHRVNGEKLVDLDITQEAWGLLCKGIAQAADRSITEQDLMQLLATAKLNLGLESQIMDGEVTSRIKGALSFAAEGVEILPKSLSFWETFTRGWYKEGDKIRVELVTPLENGKAPFAIYKVSNSIKGTATVSLEK
jgi:acyl dehydratase